MDKVRIGMIGCGSRLRGVTSLVKKASDRIDVAALCDPSEKSIRATRESLAPDATVYEDYHELVRDPAVDWVFIGSWNCFHKDHAVAAFEAGKHVFCEKPLATTVADCLAMRDAWKKSGRMFSIGFTLRYSPHYVRLKEIMESGVLGRIISMEFNETLEFNHGGYIHADWRRKTEWAGTHLLEKCCHDVDLVNWMIGSTAKRVASFGGCDFFRPENLHYMEEYGRNGDGRQAFQTWPLHTPGVDPFTAQKDIVDNQVGIIEFANGVRSTFHTNCSTATSMSERRMYLCGTEGTLRADVIRGVIEMATLGFGTSVEDRSTVAKGGHGGGDNILGESVAASMLMGAAPRASLEEGLRSAFTCFGMDESMETGRIVEMAPYWERAGIALA